MITKNLLRIVAALAVLAGGCVAQVGPDEEPGTLSTQQSLGKGPAAAPPAENKTASPSNVSNPGTDVMAGEQEGPWPVPWRGSYGTDPWKPPPDPAPQDVPGDHK